MVRSKVRRSSATREADDVVFAQVTVNQSPPPPQRNIANPREEVMLHPNLIHIPQIYGSIQTPIITPLIPPPVTMNYPWNARR